MGGGTACPTKGRNAAEAACTLAISRGYADRHYRPTRPRQPRRRHTVALARRLRAFHPGCSFAEAGSARFGDCRRRGRPVRGGVRESSRYLVNSAAAGGRSPNFRARALREPARRNTQRPADPPLRRTVPRGIRDFPARMDLQHSDSHRAGDAWCVAPRAYRRAYGVGDVLFGRADYRSSAGSHRTAAGPLAVRARVRLTR